MKRFGPVALILGLSIACGKSGESRTPYGEASKMQADRYVKTAIHRSPQGAILLPSRKAESSYDRALLNQVAHALKVPAAVCFINRGIQTIRQEVVDGERTYTHVPEGQIKIRARIAPAGDVLRAEVLESGFQDPEMDTCLSKVVENQRFPISKASLVQRIDVVYWVSLGFQDADREPEAIVELRRQTALAGNRASRCFRQGQVAPGTYPVDGLTLADRNGRTVANRIDADTLPETIQSCVTKAFSGLTMPRATEGFIRPFTTRLVFEVAQDGTVVHNDTRWLELTTLEQRAAREAKRRELIEAPPEKTPKKSTLGTPILGGGMAPPRQEDAGTQKTPRPTPASPVPVPVRP
ncbi:MAG: hypothetical protein ACPG77_08165, partial [Nannocystaceae bacterium]